MQGMSGLSLPSTVLAPAPGTKRTRRTPEAITALRVSGANTVAALPCATRPTAAVLPPLPSKGHWGPIVACVPPRDRPCRVSGQGDAGCKAPPRLGYL